jgi:hypothetical protein
VSQLEKPERLPEEFGEIWEALKEADEKSPSRQALAGRLGVSTHTIQRILVDGDVPRLEETTKTRIRRAWVRIITRLAMALDGSPREWVEKAGIPFDDDAAGVCEAEVLRVMARRGEHCSGGRPGPPSIGTDGHGKAVAGAAPARRGSAWPARITVGLAGRGAMAGNLESHGGSFLEVLTQRLVGAVSPLTQLRTERMEEHEIVRGLLTAGAGLDIGLGITETVHRRYRGLGFVRIPGVVTRLDAFCLKAAGRGGAVPDWRQAVLRGRIRNRYFMVAAGDIAHEYLAGQYGIATEEIVTTGAAGHAGIARAFLEETEKHPDRWVIFLGGDGLCGLVADSLESGRNASPPYSLEYLPGAEEECPRYPVGIALRTGAAHWTAMLEAARDDELFGAGARSTAHLYASLMTASFLDRNPAGLPEVQMLRGMIGITDFARATPDFQEVLFRNLVASLKQSLLTRLELEGTAESADALDSRATERAAAYAEALIPREWLRAIEDSLERTVAAEAHGSLRPAASRAPAGWLPWCQSCSISLEDEHNRGASDRFCRFCADEEGSLKSRSKVQNLIARWFERWQENLTHEEAMRRAGLFMTAMPAWSGN